MWLLYLLALFVFYKLLDSLVRIPITISPSGQKDNILITGCDSGFGNMFAKRLASKGFHVYATCFTEDGRAELEKATPTCLKAILMDVTKPESVDAVFRYVSSNLPEGKGLWALVNNAGVTGNVSPVVWQSRQDIRKPMEVNFFGMTNVINTFLPLVKKSRGRIVNTSSVVGRCPLPPPPYCASKHAIEGYSDALRIELAPFKVSVHLIEPGAFKTNILSPGLIKKQLKETFFSAPPGVQEEYGVDYLRAVQTAMPKLLDVMSTKLHLVVDAYEHATLGLFPRGRYLVGYDATFIWMLHFLPEWAYVKGIRMMARSPEPASCLK